MALSGKSWKRGPADGPQSPEEEFRDPFRGDAGNYMTLKVQKLREQFQEDAGKSLLFGSGLQETDKVKQANADKLFKGVAIWVNGYTKPPHQELKRLMAVHGGIFETYYSRAKVTHIICANLPDNKIRDFRNGRNPPPVLRPEWVVDSITANKLLPVGPYELERIKLDPGQARLPVLKSPATSKSLKGTSPQQESPSPKPDGSLQELQLPEQSLLQVQDHDPVEEMPTPKASEAEEEFVQDQVDRPFDPGVESNADSAEKGTNSAVEEGIQRDVAGLTESENHQAPEVEQSKEYSVLGKRKPSPEKEQSPKRVKDTGPDNLHLPARSHSTQGDPNFIQNFYKYSRLHFIGTWRTRYENMELPEEDVPYPKLNLKGPKCIIHIDMDCFFVSVAIRTRPELADKAVAVCHSKGSGGAGTAEISSANYAARKFGISFCLTDSDSTDCQRLRRCHLAGIQAGMFVSRAKQLCPDLILVPYDFKAFTEVADQMYSVLHKHSRVVQALSCDEAFVDVTGTEDPLALVTRIRAQILELTGCPASAGISHNVLLARMATRKAKPNGQFHLTPEEVLGFLAALPVSQLPGVGWSLQERLASKGIATCAELRTLTRETLQRELGAKTGDMLFNYARGIDDRPVQVTQKRKSVGAEVNWGIRFQTQHNAHKFLQGLAEEVCGRLQEANLRGRTFTLKVKKRKPNAGEPIKFMGCGECDNLSKGVTSANPTAEPSVVLRFIKQTYDAFDFDPKEVRGLGLQVTRLEEDQGARTKAQGIEAWLSKGGAKQDEERWSSDEEEERQKALLKGKMKVEEEAIPTEKALDLAVLSELPEEIRREVEADYGLLRDADERSHKTESFQKKPVSGAGPMDKQEEEQKPIQRLPPLSQVDPSVLAALPLAMQRELEHAYRVPPGNPPKHKKATSSGPQRSKGRLEQVRGSRKGGKSGSLSSRSGSEGSFYSGPLRPTALRGQHLLQFGKVRDLRDSTAGACSPTRQPEALEGRVLCDLEDKVENDRVGVECERPLMPQTFTQIDPSVLAELPEDVQEQIKHSFVAQQELERPKQQSLEKQEPSANDITWPSTLAAAFARLQGTERSKKLSSALLLMHADVKGGIEGGVESGGGAHSEEAYAAVVVKYVKKGLRDDLEEVQKVLKALHRLGKKDKFWKGVLLDVQPKVQAMVAEVYGGTLTLY